MSSESVGLGQNSGAQQSASAREVAFRPVRGVEGSLGVAVNGNGPGAGGGQGDLPLRALDPSKSQKIAIPASGEFDRSAPRGTYLDISI